MLHLGAGAGALTAPLARRAGRVVAVEIDRDLATALARRFPSVKVVAGDARRVALPREPFKVVANLPFGGATAILTRFLDPDVPLQSADGRATSMPGSGPTSTTPPSEGWVRVSRDRSL